MFRRVFGLASRRHVSSRPKTFGSPTTKGNKRATKRSFVAGSGSEYTFLTFLAGICGVAGGLFLAYDDSEVDKKPIERYKKEPRANWEKKCVDLGLTYHTDGKWWDESTYYSISSDSAAQITEATKTLHQMCMEAVGKVVNDDNLLKEFGVPHELWPVFRESWNNHDPSIYGRLDLIFDGASPPKLLEYNADTPTLLLESGIVQKQWRDDVFVDKTKYSQINELDKALQNGWQAIYQKESEKDGKSSEKIFHFSFVRDNEEDLRNAEYMASIAQKTGFSSRVVMMDQIRWNKDHFEDPSGTKIERLWKLYPWEWITMDVATNPELGISDVHRAVRWLEPPWKMILSNKAILVVLWEMFPGHKNLLPAYFSPDPLLEKNLPIITKLAAGREGANIAVRNATGSLIFDTEKSRDLYQLRSDSLVEPSYQFDAPMGRAIYQEWVKPEFYSGHTPVFSSWVINEAPAGIVIREDSNLVTNYESKIVPHVVVDINPRSIPAKVMNLFSYVTAGFSAALQAVFPPTVTPPENSLPEEKPSSTFTSVDNLFQQQDHFGSTTVLPTNSTALSTSQVEDPEAQIMSFVIEDEEDEELEVKLEVKSEVNSADKKPQEQPLPQSLVTPVSAALPSIFNMGAGNTREDREEEERRRAQGLPPRRRRYIPHG